jgi:hypothetical protein
MIFFLFVYVYYCGSNPYRCDVARMEERRGGIITTVDYNEEYPPGVGSAHGGY